MKRTFLMLGIAVMAAAAPEALAAKPIITHGVMSAEVTSSEALVWSRADQPAKMLVSLLSAQDRDNAAIEVDAASDFTGSAHFDGLQADTEYRYRVRFENAAGERSQVKTGFFRTAPAPMASGPVKLSWTGDIAGQNVCRDATEGFPIFKALAAERSDLFIGLGDMIYADNTCEAKGRYGNTQVPGDFLQAADLDNFRRHWRYNRDDRYFQRLIRSTPYYGVWDDHEVVNDFGPLHDTRSTPPYVAGVSLLPIGLQTFLEYTPMRTDPNTSHRLYRTVGWGRHAELFFLDNRQYRDHNLSADRKGRNKTMLGREQLTWLKAQLKASQATWKIIVSSVPMSIPTGSPLDQGRDGFANNDANTAPTIDGGLQSETGFEQELVEILRTLQAGDMNAVFITTDVHFAQVFRYTPFANDPDFQVHEVVIGPGNAGIFPNRAFDTSLGTESLFFHGPESAAAVTSWDEALKWFNYGTIEIDGKGHFVTRVKDTFRKTLYSLELTP